MRHRAGGLFVVLLVALLLSAMSRDADAYMDPGTGAYIFQMLIAGLVGASFALKIFWKQIKAFFSGRGPRDNDQDSESDDAPQE